MSGLGYRTCCLLSILHAGGQATLLVARTAAARVKYTRAKQGGVRLTLKLDTWSAKDTCIAAVQFLVQAMVLPCSGEGKVVKQAEQGTNIQADQAAAARQLNSHWAGSLALAEPQGPQQSAQGR